MAKENQEKRILSRRRFMGLGLGLLGAGLVAATIAEPKTAAAVGLPEHQRVVLTTEAAKPKSDWEIMQEARQSRIQKFITDADALVKRYGYANY